MRLGTFIHQWPNKGTPNIHKTGLLVKSATLGVGGYLKDTINHDLNFGRTKPNQYKYTHPQKNGALTHSSK